MIKPRTALRYAVALGIILLHQYAHGCLTPDDAAVLGLDAAVVEWDIYHGAIDYMATNRTTTPGIYNYTAPKQVRAWTGVMASAYTAMAWHDRNALDFYSRTEESDTYRRCNPRDTAEATLIENHAKEAFAYSYLWAILEFIPEWTTDITTYADSLNMDLTKCAIENEFGCGLDTPTGLARKIVEQVSTIMKYDGWNADGSMSTEPTNWQFQEFRDEDDYCSLKKYCRRKWKRANDDCRILDFARFDEVCWCPQEFQFYDVIYTEQYHMRHIADTGRAYFIGDSYICDKETLYPCYDLEEEARNVMSRISSNGDDEKAEIEFYDNVFQWFSTFTYEFWDADTDSTQFEKIKGITASIASMYDATILVWKDKLRHGVLRPRTYINKNLPAANIGWTPYIMDHPTPEYPSHVACMCSAFTNAMRRLNNGVGSINPAISFSLLAGSSLIEENEPTADVPLSFETWRQIMDKCDASRLNSGSHFSKAADEADQLCGPVGTIVVDAFATMVSGTVPANAVNTNKLPIYLKRCPVDPFLFWRDREEFVDETGAKYEALAQLKGISLKELTDRNYSEFSNNKIAKKAWWRAAFSWDWVSYMLNKMF